MKSLADIIKEHFEDHVILTDHYMPSMMEEHVIIDYKVSVIKWRAPYHCGAYEYSPLPCTDTTFFEFDEDALVKAIKKILWRKKWWLR